MERENTDRTGNLSGLLPDAPPASSSTADPHVETVPTRNAGNDDENENVNNNNDDDVDDTTEGDYADDDDDDISTPLLAERPRPVEHRTDSLMRRGNMTQMLRELGSTSKRRFSGSLMTLTQREALRSEHDRLQVRNFIVFMFTLLELVFFVLLRRGNVGGPLNHYLDATLFGSVGFMFWISRQSDVSTRGERVLLSFFAIGTLVVSVLLMGIFSSPCSSCFTLLAKNTIHSSNLSLLESQETGWRLWHVLLKGEEDDPDDVGTVSCRRCVGNIITAFSSGFYGYLMKRFGMEYSDDREIVEIKLDQDKLLEDDTGDLSAWYIDYAKAAKARDLKNFNIRIANTLESQGYLGGPELADALEEYFCSPASRFDDPDPTQFLEGLKHARFTGENERSTNMTTSVLQRIMRGDVLKEMGVAVCFILRFALLVPEDHSLETKPISHTTNLPRMNEEGMKAHVATDELPGLIVPMIDQEVDPDGKSTKRFKKIMDLFATLPFEKNYLYFQTKEEYLAFYRWELESTVQDDWFFPRWLMETEKKDKIAELQAMKTKHSKDHLILEHQTSDLALSDRIFFGTGMKYITPIKLKGIDVDHDFQFPATAASYPFKYQREKMRYTNKPSQEDLLKMVKKMYPGQVNSRTTMLQWRRKILQVDFAALEPLPGRPEFYPAGCILYIDVRSRMPMGIWVSPESRMYLPDEGRDWEHAKWYYRVSERAGLTAHHVPECHLGWSASLSTAVLQTLDPQHGLRALLKPFTLQAHSVNAAAYNMLVKNHSVLTHASGLQTLGVRGTFHLIYSGLNYSQTIPEMLEHQKLEDILDTNEFPWWSQGKRLYEAHRKWVEKFVDLIFPTEEAMLNDDSVVRFWNHINTQGRHNDPCVCDMSSDLFFDDTLSKWPAFETTHTCLQVMDFASFLRDNNLNTRRQRWCSGFEKSTFEKLQILYKFYEKECEERPNCYQMSYADHFMRNGMGLPPLRSKAQLVGFLATNIWHVTAGHQFLSDNIPYFSDPFYSGVRFKEFDDKGEPPLKVDVGSYVFGTAIAALTTVRGPPLMADWTPLYNYYASTRKDLHPRARQELLAKLNLIHQQYKFELVDLSKDFFEESIKRRVNQRQNNFIPLTQQSSVSV